MDGVRIFAFVVSVLISLSMGCGKPNLYSTEYETQGWYETEVGGIRVLTNGRLEVAKRSLRKLERFLALAKKVDDLSLPSGSITLHMFDRAAQYQGFVGDYSLGGHMIAGPNGLYIALGSDHPGATTRTLFHEVVHLLLSEKKGYIPAWYQEGYAEFLGAAILRPGVATLGRPLDDRVETLNTNRPMELVDFFSIGAPSTLSVERALLYYAEAWAFIHFALLSPQADQREPQLYDFLDELSVGKSPGRAFMAAFGENMRRVQRPYLRHRVLLAKKGEILYRHYEIKESNTEIRFRPVPTIDVDRDLAEHAMAMGRNNIALLHYANVLRSLPTDAEALLGRVAALSHMEKFDDAEKALATIDPRSTHASLGRGTLDLIWFKSLKRAQFSRSSRSQPSAENDEDKSEPDETEALGRLQSAFEKLSVVAAENPQCTTCWEGIAVYHSAHPDGDPALGLEAEGHAGPEVQGGTLRGELLLRLGRFAEAKAVAEHILATSHHASLAREAHNLRIRILRAELEADYPS